MNLEDKSNENLNKNNDNDPKPTTSTLNEEDTNRKKQIRQLIDNVATILLAGIENGLFEQTNIQNDENLKSEKIHKLICEARMHLDKNLDDAEYKQEEALGKYFTAVNKAGLKWKFCWFYAGPIWIFLIGILGGIFVFYICGIEKQLIDPNSMFGLKISSAAIDATAWGIIGSVLRGLWNLRLRIGENVYRKSWNLQYLGSPFIGGILGAIVYILILGGLVSVTGQSITPTNSVVIVPIAAFAGFNWKWAIRLFNKIQNIIDAGKDDDKS